MGGSTGEIIQAFEEVAEGRGRRFWNITMSATSQDSGLDTPRRQNSSNQQKDPLNTFKAFRYIFDEVENKPWLSKGKQERTKGKKKEEDMLDIYADWASATLDDQRIEKKRSKRGRGPAPGRRTLVGQQSSSQNMVRRPGTPTVAVKKVKGWDADVGWIEESKTPKKDRK